MRRVPRPARTIGVLAVVLLTAAGACSSEPERHPLPRLPELGGVVLPAGFAGYERPTAPFASRHPVHVDSAFFERDPSTDLGGNHHCGAQITVSGTAPDVTTPTAHTELLGTKLCDASWFATQWDEAWRQDPADPRLWTLEFTYSRSGWFGVHPVAAVGVVLFAPERGVTVGVWADQDLYPVDQAVALAQQTARSIGP